jgi:hypothetical protein
MEGYVHRMLKAICAIISIEVLFFIYVHFFRNVTRAKTRAECITTATITTATTDDVTVIHLLIVQKPRSRTQIISRVTVVCWKIYGRQM